jgi:pimeloyl-ACP methyl ester carboxylesterase
VAWSDFFIEHEARRIAVRDYGGAGPAMLLLHGGGGTVAGWDELASYLVPEFTVVGFDAHGHGHSDTPRTKDARLPLREIDAVRRALGMERPLLIGSSMGGGNAVRYAADGGACMALVVIDGAPFWRVDEVDTEPFDAAGYRAEMEAAGWGGVLTHDAVETAVEAAVRDCGDARAAAVEADQRRAHAPLGDGTYQRKPTLDYIVTMREMGNEVRRLGGVELYDRIEVPVLLLNAERGYTPAGATTEEQRARLDAVAASHPNVTSEWIDAGHLIHWEKPRLVANRIREFAATAL